MEGRPLSTFVLTALALWGLWLWRNHRLGGHMFQSKPAPASGKFPVLPPYPGAPNFLPGGAK